jgi:glutaminyl-tRNA synthetase
VVGDVTETRYQFERTGYFWRDPVDSRPEALVFNRIVTLRDTWAAKRSQELTLAPGPAPDAAAPARVKSGKASPEPRAPAPPRVSEQREGLRRSQPELARRMVRYQEALGLSREEADILTGSRELSDLFEAALAVHSDAEAVAAWVVNELPRAAGERTVAELPFGGRELGRLVSLVSRGRVARLAAKEVLSEMVVSAEDPETIVKRRGLEGVAADDALLPLVESTLAAWPDKVKEYRAGKTGLLGFFVGQVVRSTEGRGDPVRVKALLLERLGAQD